MRLDGASARARRFCDWPARPQVRPAQDLARVEQIRNPVQPDQEVRVKEPVPVAAVTGTTTAKPSLSARWFGRKR